MQGHALTGLPAPTAGTDAAPKSYVDATLPKLSQIAIDADKNWNGKSIINLDHIETIRILPVASDETRISGFGLTPVTVPAIYIRGTVRAGGQALAEQIGKLYVNGVLRYSWGPADYGAHGHADIVVEGGDVISFTNVVHGSVYIKCSDALPVTRPESPTWS
jgi:hypothetical protein